MQIDPPVSLFARLREAMAEPRPPRLLDAVAELVAEHLEADACSIFAMRSGDLLELAATRGLLATAVGRTRLRVGEGIVGIAAATGRPMNLEDARSHPAFARRPETGEDAYHALLAAPVRRAGRTLGVLVLQDRARRLYSDAEIGIAQTVALLLADVLAADGVREAAAEESLGGALSRQFSGGRLAPGIVVGPVLVVGPGAPPRRLLAEDAAAELARVEEAAAAMRRDLDELIETGLPAVPPSAPAPDNGAASGEDADRRDAPREVLEATRLLAAGSGWLRRVAEVIEGGLTAEAAVHRVMGEVRDRMRRITDPHLRERLADIEDLAQRMVAALAGDPEPAPVPPGAILVARRLGPAQLLAWHGRGIAGVAIEEASSAGHAAILARALGLPALGGLRGLLDAVADGDEVVLDAEAGLVVLRPDAELLQSYDRARVARRAREAGYAKLRDAPARTADGARLRMLLNVGLSLELEQLDLTGADGIGLFRTEIAMLARGDVADMGEQAAIYARALDAAGDRPVHFRTLDLGGDKLLPGAPKPDEENPAMGWRSLRVGLDRPALLRRQLRAMLLAASGRDLHVMFPMVATVQEFRAARRLFWTEAARVRPAPRTVRVGSMLEIPALLWQLPSLLAEADFLSLGTNDLMQFLFAADRGAPRLANRYDLLSAPVLDLLEQVAEQARMFRKPVVVCGEAASRPPEALALLALGFDALSMPAGALLPLKSVLAEVDLGEFRAVLDTLRRSGQAEASMREPILGWARERGLALGPD